MPDFSSILGLDQNSLTWWQMMLRAVIVYVAAIAMVRLGEKRFLGRTPRSTSSSGSCSDQS